MHGWRDLKDTKTVTDALPRIASSITINCRAKVVFPHCRGPINATTGPRPNPILTTFQIIQPCNHG